MINSQISIFAFYAARVILGLLLVLSVLSIAFFMERMIFFRKRMQRDFAAVFKQIERAESVPDLMRIMAACPSVETEIILNALKGSPESNEAFMKRVDGFFHTEKENWSRYSYFLGSVGSNAPFIGLLGTVFGILKAFADLSLAATGGPQVVMAGISEALIATAAGLLVAIPAVVFYNICKVKVKKAVVNLQAMTAFISARNLFKHRTLNDNPGQSSKIIQKSYVHKVN